MDRPSSLHHFTFSASGTYKPKPKTKRKQQPKATSITQLKKGEGHPSKYTQQQPPRKHWGSGVLQWGVIVEEQTSTKEYADKLQARSSERGREKIEWWNFFFLYFFFLNFRVPCWDHSLTVSKIKSFFFPSRHACKHFPSI